MVQKGSSEEMYTWLIEGQMFDVIFPTSSLVLRLTQQNMLYPVRPTQISNRENLNPDFLNFDFDPENLYTTPYAWGTTGVTYNAQVIDETLQSWEQFFTYKGPVAWLDDYRMMLNIALIVQGFKPNSINPDEIKAAKDYLLAHIDNVVLIGSYKSLREGLNDGLIDMTIDYNGNALFLSSACHCDTYHYTIPPEGSTIWIDSLAIPINAPNKHLAEVYISYVMLP